MTNKKWVARTSIIGVSVDVAAAELGRIEAEHGCIRTQTLVDESRPNTAALHPAFDWNNKEAGEKWRLHQARNIIKCIQFVDCDLPIERQMTTPGWVSVKEDAPTAEGKQDGRRYVSIETAIESPSLFREALELLVQKVHSAQQAALALEDVAKKSDKPEQMVYVALAVKALETASDAIRAMH